MIQDGMIGYICRLTLLVTSLGLMDSFAWDSSLTSRTFGINRFPNKVKENLGALAGVGRPAPGSCITAFGN